MEMNTTHSAFDLEMELICTLPKHPLMVHQRDVAADLGLPHASDAGRLAKSAAVKYRIGIHCCNGDGGGPRVLAITPETWKRAQALSNSYWAEVNGKQTDDEEINGKRTPAAATTGANLERVREKSVSVAANATGRKGSGGAHAARGGPGRE